MKKIVKKTDRLFISIIRKILEKDYSGKGERQVSTTINGIRKDHVGRYKFVCQFINRNDVVFDCACGVGYGSFIMVEEVNLSKIIAVDKDRRAIEFAKKHYGSKKITYITKDLFRLNFPDNCFDCIVSFETLEHVNGIALVNFFYRKLKEDALLIISTPNQDAQPFNRKDYNFHLRHYAPSEFSGLLTSSGFEILGRYTQYDREKEEVSEGWDGLFNIAIARKHRTVSKSGE